MIKYKDIVIDLKQVSPKYQKYIRLFINYLQWQDVAEKDIFSHNVIEQSVIYHSQTYKISKMETLVNYLQAIAVFADYIPGAENPFVDNDSLANYGEQLVKENNIQFKAISEAGFFNELQLIELLKALSDYDYQGLLDGSINGYKKHVRYRTLCMLIKIMMIAPTRKKYLTWLKVDAIDLAARVIEVRGINFDIPSHLFYEIQEYLSLREEYNKENGIEDDYFFIHSPKLRRVKDSDFNIWFGEFIYETGVFDIDLKTTDNGFSYCTFRIAPVKDAVLYQMVCNGAPLSLIAHIDDRDIASVAKKFHVQPVNMSELTNSVLKQSNYYKYL